MLTPSKHFHEVIARSRVGSSRKTCTGGLLAKVSRLVKFGLPLCIFELLSIASTLLTCLKGIAFQTM